jgi:hypothetical protein
MDPITEALRLANTIALNYGELQKLTWEHLPPEQQGELAKLQLEIIKMQVEDWKLWRTFFKDMLDVFKPKGVTP